jgi:hypothetical protein
MSKVDFLPILSILETRISGVVCECVVPWCLHLAVPAVCSIGLVRIGFH